MRLRSMFAALLLLLPAPALADVTATYAVEGGKAQLVVEADDGGNLRASVGGKFMLIRRDGVDYVLAADAAGDLKIARFDAVVDLFGGQMTGKGRDTAAGKPEMTFVLELGAQQIVAGRDGMVWRFGPGPKDGKPGDLIDVVMSTDPALAPIGQFFHSMFAKLAPVMSDMFGGGNFAATTDALFSKGAPLQIGPMLTLQSVDMADLPASRFELGGPVLEPMEWMEALSPPGGESLPPLP